MSHPNNRRRRNRTFRLEALESRALLSTAGVVSRPGAAVAPLARVAQFSKIGGDPKFEGQLKGTFRVYDDKLQFTAIGYVSGKPFGNLSVFAGTAQAGMTPGGKTTYTSGAGTLTNESGTNQLIIQSFKITVDGTKFAISGKTGLGVGGDLKGVKKGTIVGKGSIARNTGSIYVDITVEAP